MKKTYWIIGAVVVAVLAWYFLIRKPATATPAAVNEATAKAWEARVQHHMAWLRKAVDQQQLLKDKAEKAGRTYEQQLRLDAEWYAEKEGTPRP